MVKLYVADITNLPNPLSCPELLKRLPAERQQKIHNMKQEKSRKQSMGAGLLLQKVLALYHMEMSTLAVGEHGKPMVEGLQFNLSHSGNLVICAVSNQAVGCDVEMIRKAPKGVAERYFSESEKEYLNQFCGEDYDTAFFRLWTMKESYVKMTGEGMSLPQGEYEIVVGDSLDISSENMKGSCYGYARVNRGGQVQDCYISEVAVRGYIISICAKSSAHVEVIWKNL